MAILTIPASKEGVKMTYRISHDDTQIFEFAPVPFIQCDTAFDLSGKEETGQTITINVTGTLVAPKHLENEGIRDEDAESLNYNIGLTGMSPLERLRRKMEMILSVPGGEFKIYCICGDKDGGCEDVVYFKIYPQMIGNISFQQSPDNWTQTIPYTFQIVVHRTDLFNKDGQPIYLESIDENWSMELVDEKVFPSHNDIAFQNRNADSLVVMKLTHTLNATGKKVYGAQEFDAARDGQLIHEWRRDNIKTSIADYDSNHSEERYTPMNTSGDNIKSPYQHAKEWIETKLYNLDNIQQSLRADDDPNRREEFFYLSNDGIFNWNRYKSVFNHTRQKTGNEVAGTYSVTESWIIIVGNTDENLPKDDYGNIIGATDEYTLDYKHNSNNGIDTVTIEGTIAGYQEGNLNQVPVRSKIYQAEQLFKRLAEGNYFHRRADHYIKDIVTHSRACDVLAAESPNGIPDIINLNDKKDEVICSLNIIPVSKSIRRQIIEGIISYSYEFNTKCPNLFADTLMESFTPSWTYPNDVISPVVIPGRQSGPLIFSANTMTSPKCSLNFEIILKPACHLENPIEFNDNIDFNKMVDKLRVRVRPSQIDGLNNCRKRIRAVAKVYYDYFTEIGLSIRKIESDNDTWNPMEGRYSGSITFVLGVCGNGHILQSLSKYFTTEDQKQSTMAM